MNKYHLRYALLVVALVLPSLATGQTEMLEQVLVKVNGEIFTKTDLEVRQVGALRALGRTDATSNPTDAQLRKMLDDLTPQLMVSIVDEILLVQRGKDLGYTLSDEQFKSIIENIKKENKIETDEAFQAALKEENVTMAELRKNLERQMMISNVTRNEVESKIAVSEDESRKYYDAHIKDFTTSPTITLREVLVTAPTGDAGTPADSAARAKAESVRTRAGAGDDFAKLVAELSDGSSRANGGLLGPLSIDDLSPQVREVIEPLKVGDLTTVLRTATGYQLLKLESSSPRLTKPFDEVKDQIGERVFAQKQRVEEQRHLDKLRQQAIIEWKNRDLQKAYDMGLAELKASIPSQ